MLSSKIHIDLPSTEQLRKKTWFEKVTSIFGASPNLSTGFEALTVSGFVLIDGVMKGFSRADVSDAISLMVDRKVIFRDDEGHSDDLQEMHRAALRSDVLKHSFKEMHAVLAHHEAGIHFLFDVRILREAIVGQPEMEVQCSGRIESLRIQADETASRYTKRVRAAIKQDGFISKYVSGFNKVIRRVADALAQFTPNVSVKTSDTEVNLIRLQPKQVANFRKLSFGSDVTPPTYRAVPTRQRHGAYRDPFYYYYYDPYYDLVHYLVLYEALEYSLWHAQPVHVVDTSGKDLGPLDLYNCPTDDPLYHAGAVQCDSPDVIHVEDAIENPDPVQSEHELWETDETGRTLDAEPPTPSNDSSGGSSDWSSTSDASSSDSSTDYSSSSDSSSSDSSSSDDSSKNWSSCSSSSSSSCSSSSSSSSCSSSSSSSCGSSCSSSSSSCGSY